MGKMKQIKARILADLPEFKRTAESVANTHELCRHYDLPVNGKQTIWFRDLLKVVGLGHDFYTRAQHEKRRLHPVVTKTCPVCSKPFTTSAGMKGETTYCSHTCSNRDVSLRPHSPESREKMSQIMTERAKRLGVARRATVPRPCANCGQPFLPKLDKTLYCSGKCRCKAVNSRPGQKERFAAGQYRVIAEGRHKGWKSRTKVKRSYAERFFDKVLTHNDIPFEAEPPCGPFFIDFAITLANGVKIALEIDGKQHRLEERQLSDRRKDLCLEAAGWNVYRIPWNEINSDRGKEKMRGLIAEFLAYHKGMSL